MTGKNNRADDDFFITPTGDQTTYANGPGDPRAPRARCIWFHAGPGRRGGRRLPAQIYDGQPVLTWWQGTGLGGLSSGTDYIYNDHYQQIATVNAGNGYCADGHEFLITPWNTALILAYTTATADLTSIGGPADQTVIDGIVQEIDIRTGQVLFQWNSADHVPYSDSEQPLPASPSTPWDWFHINAVHLAWDGNLLIDARNTWTTYDVSLRTGHDQLGARRQGQHVHRAGRAGPDAGQRRRDLRLAARPGAGRPGHLHVLRRRAPGTPQLPYSRAVTVQLELPHQDRDTGVLRQPARRAVGGRRRATRRQRATATRRRRTTPAGVPRRVRAMSNAKLARFVTAW